MKNIFISGKTLSQSREKVGLSQENLADELGMNRVSIANWEKKDKVKITEKQEKILCRVLNVTTEQLQYQPKDKDKIDILDHPVIKSLVAQSEYIMNRVRALEEENKLLRAKK